MLLRRHDRAGSIWDRGGAHHHKKKQMKDIQKFLSAQKEGHELLVVSWSSMYSNWEQVATWSFFSMEECTGKLNWLMNTSVKHGRSNLIAFAARSQESFGLANLLAQ